MASKREDSYLGYHLEAEATSDSDGKWTAFVVVSKPVDDGTRDTVPNPVSYESPDRALDASIQVARTYIDEELGPLVAESGS